MFQVADRLALETLQFLLVTKIHGYFVTKAETCCKNVAGLGKSGPQHVKQMQLRDRFQKNAQQIPIPVACDRYRNVNRQQQQIAEQQSTVISPLTKQL